MQSSEYEAIKISKDNQVKFVDQVVVEAPLQININNEPYTVVMRTPGDDEDLIRGLLFAEDIYRANKKPVFSIIDNSKNHFTTINVQLPKQLLGKGYMNKRSLLSVSSCGICGKKSIEHLKVNGKKLIANLEINLSQIEHMYEIMNSKQVIFKKTGASHAASIFDKNLKLLSIKEDIGRHNAVDKVIGKLLNIKENNKPKYLLVSSRVSYEIVTKAFIFKIPTIIAVSGCSSLAIDFAKEFGINLIGFTRNKKMTIYN